MTGRTAHLFTLGVLQLILLVSHKGADFSFKICVLLPHLQPFLPVQAVLHKVGETLHLALLSLGIFHGRQVAEHHPHRVDTAQPTDLLHLRHRQIEDHPPPLSDGLAAQQRLHLLSCHCLEAGHAGGLYSADIGQIGREACDACQV